MKIATEEAFATEGLMKAYATLLEDGAPGEPGLADMVGRLLKPSNEWTERLAGQLLDLGDLRLTQMDEGGIDRQIIVLTAPGVQVFDADTACALAEEANDILAGAVAAHPTRFHGLAAIAPQAPQRAALELERGVGLGLKGAIINSHTKGEYLDGSGFQPILEAAQALDVPIYLHPRPVAPGVFATFAERQFDGAFWGFQTETGLHALRMIVTGVFDRFPKLKIVLGHLGEGLPFWLNRLDRQFQRSPRNVYHSWTAKRLPSEYFLENFWITSAGHNWDPAVRFCEEVVGEDRLMLGVDYPYEVCKQQVDQSLAINLKDPEKFYELNAKRVFKLN
ncbi:MAG: amidohydrolase family protein [Rhodospirillales bacterium]|nr:amidohydrolase family protein [Rhodospirillales bacterium]